MSPVADDVLVGSLLAASLGYAVMKLGPRALRRSLIMAAARGLAAAPAIFRLNSVAQRLEAASLQKTTGACGGCDNCETTASPAQSPGGVVEVTVPLAKIGRRIEH